MKVENVFCRFGIVDLFTILSQVLTGSCIAYPVERDKILVCWMIYYFFFFFVTCWIVYWYVFLYFSPFYYSKKNFVQNLK